MPRRSRSHLCAHAIVIAGRSLSRSTRFNLLRGPSTISIVSVTLSSLSNSTSTDYDLSTRICVLVNSNSLESRLTTLKHQRSQTVIISSNCHRRLCPPRAVSYPTGHCGDTLKRRLRRDSHWRLGSAGLFLKKNVWKFLISKSLVV